MRKGYNMTITEFNGKGGALRYDLRNDDGGFIARFTGLDDAARVARYIAGAEMDSDERQRAIDAMQDAQVARTLGRTLNAAKKHKKAAGAAEQAETAF